MKKFTLLLSVILLCGSLTQSFAQARRSSFRVDAPASLQGYKIISEIDSTSATAPWGTGIDSTWEGFPVGYDATNPDGCGTFAPGTFTGKFALIFRGGCEFGAKALAAQNAGARGVILVNNLLGVAGMGAGAAGLSVEIPVVMVTTTDGKAMRDEITAGGNVFVSLTDWRFNPIANPIDIGFMNDGPVHPIARAIPAHQMSTINGNLDENFRTYVGARFYNFGTGSWTNVIQKGVLSYNPSLTGAGAFTPIDSNAVNWTLTGGVTTTDSILSIYIDTIGGVLQGFTLDDSAVGTYRMVNEMVVDTTLQETALSELNNTWTYDFTINDSIYSKAQYDFVKKRPISNYYVNVASASEWGPVLYFRNSGYIAKEAQVVIMRDVITDSVFANQNMVVKLYKWDDGDANGGIDYGTELEQVGEGTYALTTAEIVPIEGLNLNIKLENLVSANLPISLEANSKYWLTATINGGTGGFGIGADYFSDYSANTAFGISEGNPVYADATMFGGGFSNAGSPSIALVTVKKPVVVIPEGLNDINSLNNLVKVYPNPTAGLISVDVKLAAKVATLTMDVIDVTGKVLTSTTQNNIGATKFGFNTAPLANGTYFVRVTTENGVSQTKFVVSK
jgi:hypothetical protein